MTERRVYSEAERDAIFERYRIAQRPLLDELSSVGIEVKNVWDLEKSYQTYPQALPVLFKHLAMSYPAKVRTEIVYALCVKWAKPFVWKSLVNIYKSEPNLCALADKGEIGSPSGPKIAMADGISTLALPNDLKEVIELLRCKANGPSRVILVSVLSRSRQKEAKDALVELASDPELKNEIALRLRRKRQ